jgi:putative addiction module component (TIGR02574 family)
MSASLEELKATLSGLPVPERAELAHYLLRTLEPAEEGAAAEWLALAERRMADVRAGRVVGIPAEQVLESLRRSRG